MLILTRRLTETLVIGDSVTLTVLDIKGSRVRIGVNTPRDVVKREESFHKAATGHRMPDSSP
jgi:carbon storage regulator